MVQKTRGPGPRTLAVRCGRQKRTPAPASSVLFSLGIQLQSNQILSGFSGDPGFPVDGNEGKTSKLQVTVDRCTEGVIESIKKLGIHGTTKSEVVASIIRDWLWQNEEKLRRNGITFKKDI